jgi:hypothetical protein
MTCGGREDSSDGGNAELSDVGTVDEDDIGPPVKAFR